MLTEKQKAALTAAGWTLWDGDHDDEFPELSFEEWRSPAGDCVIRVYDEAYYDTPQHKVQNYTEEGDLEPANMQAVLDFAALTGIGAPSPAGIEQKLVTEEEIQRLRELEAKATPAPWSSEEDPSTGLHQILKGDQVICDGGTASDLELVALSRNLLPSLLVEREEMQKRIKELEGALADMVECAEESWSPDRPVLKLARKILGEGGKPDGD